MKNICLFAGYNINKKIEDYVVYYIKELSKLCDIYYLSDCETEISELEKLTPYVKEKYSYRHEKYDFGSWQELINKIGYQNLEQYENLILCDDSVFGPLFDLKKVFDIMNSRNVDFWGITENTFNNVEHIQSYFVNIKRNVFQSDTFKNFFNSVEKEDNKVDVVIKYELNLTKLLSDSGFTYSTYIDNNKLTRHIKPEEYFNWLDPNLYWKQIIKLNTPFLKKNIFDFRDKSFVDFLYNWKSFLKLHTKYDTNLIQTYLSNNKIYFKTPIKTGRRRFKFLNKRIIDILKSSYKPTNIKYLALYLPQFHTFKENDEWWGKGFTEWTNTKPMKPLFDGHYQPHEPVDELGYYDLSDVNIMIKQAQMAKKYGIFGFSYYYYWFNGRKLMEKPLENMLNNKNVNIPFCLFWANHNWTRAWDAGNKEILLEQTYDETTNKRFIDDLIPYFKDERYIKIDGKPMFLVYEAHKIPNPKETVKEWRTYAKEKYGIDLYLVSIQQNNTFSPKIFGYDAAMEGAPNFLASASLLNIDKRPALYNGAEVTFYDYLTDAFIHILRRVHGYKLFKCVYPMWDNTPRRKEKGGWMFLGSNPELYKKFIATITLNTAKQFKPKERFVFINAWNEWAEGAHLEPCKKYGYENLEITKEVSKMNFYELTKNCFDKKITKEMKTKLYPFKIFTKEKYDNKRIIKLLGLQIFKYTKKVKI